ncbi:hypothetical protein MGYG_05687 [Nannizzia gypsea CBS 118893]|uniref:protein-tyrosine-phosphatase n=1 Tax=Arthroderma gypseum (strain ATCC MYA-4604 / CBS 118893) TaxID=535722 RepID=E4UXA2_ARTGP|nr:hypothetical protein MGYG_05687 [Nannizzia gypsea CBS 118893]EFR02689.1 hypothetical protein MGYG_05687 [Nannizzia gypsea CBS 118893]
MAAVSVLFVCLSIIITRERNRGRDGGWWADETGRSPMAEAVFRHISSSKEDKTVTFSKLDSAGTCAAHIHDPPDPRTMSTLKKHGITDFTHAARRVKTSDFTEFDYIIAMDQENYDSLMYSRSRVKGEQLAEVRMFGDFDADRLAGSDTSSGESEEVPDPYYGGRDGFDRVYEMVTRLSHGFIDYLEKKHAADAAAN